SSPVTHKIDGRDGVTLRVRIPGLISKPGGEEVKDGFIDAVKLGRLGNDTLLLVTYVGVPGEVRASALSDPPRLVLDFMKPGEEKPREATPVAGPLRTLVLDAGHG